MKKLYILFIIIILSTQLLVSENIHGPVSNIINIKEDEKTFFSVEQKLENLLILNANLFNRLKAIEIEIDFPKELLKYKENFGLFFYETINPKPKFEIKNYTGIKKYVEIVPKGKKQFFIIPLSNMNKDLTSSFDTKVFKDSMKEKNFPLLLTILPLMKGVPDSVYEIPITINIKEILYDLGELKININYPDNSISKFQLFIDNKKVENLNNTIELTTGLHNLVIQSESYKEQNISFGISKDEKTIVNINLEKSTPKLLINAPSNTITYLDGKKIDFLSTEAMDITEGKHNLLFKLADFKASKEFTALSGKTYSISLFLDILIQEN